MKRGRDNATAARVAKSLLQLAVTSSALCVTEYQRTAVSNSNTGFLAPIFSPSAGGLRPRTQGQTAPTYILTRQNALRPVRPSICALSAPCVHIALLREIGQGAGAAPQPSLRSCTCSSRTNALDCFYTGSVISILSGFHNGGNKLPVCLPPGIGPC
jgi:hypothetical protein